ncbi:MAG TPA: hypothetical protein PLQ36_03370 [Candidatus Gracilibacteria bacterium]|nr:hypothetical protein [Candidatus Gracilibacteria bacterium]
MKILIATENRAKVQAVKEVFTQRFPQAEFFTEFLPCFSRF